MPSGERPILALDTSTETAGIALYDLPRVSELTWLAGRNQTASILEQVEYLLRLNGAALSDIGLIAVAIGPGGFNGLRVGLSLAKGLCFSLGIPIAGVDTLDAVAYPHAGARIPIRAFVPAGRSRVVFADYRYRHGRWVRLSERRNERQEAILDGVGERTLIAGEVNAEIESMIEENSLAVLPPPALRLRRPSYIAEIARERWIRGETDRLDALEPVYIHGTGPADRSTVKV